MNGPDGKPSLRDEDLVAYLDHELPPDERAAVERAAAKDSQIAARLAALQVQPAEMRAAFASLLSEAPTARLAAVLDSLGSPGVGKPAQLAPPRQNAWAGRRLVAAGIALLLAGGLADHAFIALAPAVLPQDPGHWRGVVADYVRLYTPETLANIPDDPSLRARELADVGATIGLQLSPEAVSLPGILLKRSQILRYDAKPIAEINYLDPRHGPLALCIVSSGQSVMGPRLEVRRGLHLAYWNDGRHGFMVIGGLSPSSLREIAQSLEGRIDAAPV